MLGGWRFSRASRPATDNRSTGSTHSRHRWALASWRHEIRLPDQTAIRDRGPAAVPVVAGLSRRRGDSLQLLGWGYELRPSRHFWHLPRTELDRPPECLARQLGLDRTDPRIVRGPLHCDLRPRVCR